jgi:hypothetical protein
MRFVNAQTVHEPNLVAGNELCSVGVIRFIAFVGAVVIEGDAAIALGEFRHLEFRGVEQADQARNENEGRALVAPLT